MQRFIGLIYEAAAFPKRWPAVLQEISDELGNRGAVIVLGEPNVHPTWLASPGFQREMEDFASEGWLVNSTYAAPLFENIHPGFSTPIDHYSVDALDAVPAYAEFMKPRGFIGAAGTIIQGPDHNAVQLSFEGFASHDLAGAAVRAMDPLRPHLARALSLSAQLRLAEGDALIDALDRLDLAAAIVGSDGGVRRYGSLFERRVHDCATISAGRLRFRDRAANAMFGAALVSNDAAHFRGQSFVARRGPVEEALAIHMLPLMEKTRQLFGFSGFLLLAVGAANRAIPGADLLRLMFDLTPSEARLTRLLLEGQALAVAATRLKIRETTARVHLRSIFAKTGVSRQSELLGALCGLPVFSSDGCIAVST